MTQLTLEHCQAIATLLMEDATDIRLGMASPLEDGLLAVARLATKIQAKGHACIMLNTCQDDPYYQTIADILRPANIHVAKVFSDECISAALNDAQIETLIQGFGGTWPQETDYYAYYGMALEHQKTRMQRMGVVYFEVVHIY